MRLIEFAGLPGSGKTTIVNRLASDLLFERETVYTRNKMMADDKSAMARHAVRARYVLRGLMTRPGLFLGALRLIRQDGQASLLSLAKVCWNFWCVLGWYLWLGRHAQSGVVLVDQGIIQAIWSVRFAAKRNEADWREFIASLPFEIDTVVVLWCDLAVVQERLSGRVGSYSRLERPGNSGDDWSRASAELEALVNVTPARVVSVESSDAERADEILDSLREELGL